jgi:Protein of unknown function (DUF3035)
MNKVGMVAGLVGAVLLVGGCEGVKQDLGIGAKRPPDEFSVYSRAPLNLPPDFALRPPATETGASQAAAPREIALKAMLGGTSPATPSPTGTASAATSPGLQALLERTGGNSAEPGIRAQINQETTILADADQSFVERLMFWSDNAQPASVVDPSQETRRIQENQALNRPLTQGETPIIRRQPKALLEGIF